MTRMFAAAGLLTAAVFACGPDVDACGDKSLSAGGIRMQRALAARYPASILMYVPSASRLPSATRELKLHETLQQVGHKYTEVTTWPELKASVDSGQFNIILTDFATTGDGLMAALQVLAVQVEAARPASETLRVFAPLPQYLKNVRYRAGSALPLEQAAVKAAIEAGEAELTGKGRLLIRKSGTEPLIRVMAEGEDEALVARVVADIVKAVEAAAA